MNRTADPDTSPSWVLSGLTLFSFATDSVVPSGYGAFNCGTEGAVFGTGGAATRYPSIARNAIGGPNRNHNPRHRKVKRQ